MSMSNSHHWPRGHVTMQLAALPRTEAAHAKIIGKIAQNLNVDGHDAIRKASKIQSLMMSAAKIAFHHWKKMGKAALPVTLSSFCLFIIVMSSSPSTSSSTVMGADPGTEIAAPKAQWLDMVKPISLFTLASDGLAREPRQYMARRHVVGGGRQDIMTFGSLDMPGPYFRLNVYRIGKESVSEAPFFVDMARRAADANISVARSGLPSILKTRFGSFETADLMLVSRTPKIDPDKPSAAEAENSCLGFRLSVGGPNLRIGGLACGTRQRPMDRSALACILDHIDLASAGEDRELARFFARSELNRDTSCSASRLEPNISKTSWLDPGAPIPPLRTIRK